MTINQDTFYILSFVCWIIITIVGAILYFFTKKPSILTIAISMIAAIALFSISFSLIFSNKENFQNREDQTEQSERQNELNIAINKVNDKESWIFLVVETSNLYFKKDIVEEGECVGLGCERWVKEAVYAKSRNDKINLGIDLEDIKIKKKDNKILISNISPKVLGTNPSNQKSPKETSPEPVEFGELRYIEYGTNGGKTIDDIDIYADLSSSFAEESTSNVPGSGDKKYNSDLLNQVIKKFDEEFEDNRYNPDTYKEYYPRVIEKAQERLRAILTPILSPEKISIEFTNTNDDTGNSISEFFDYLQKKLNPELPHTQIELDKKEMK